MRRSWPPIIDRARVLAVAFERRFDRPPTLRRLHYELVSDLSATEAGYANTQGDYKTLSSVTAEGRRAGTFPDLSESGRQLSRDQGFEDADDLREYVRAVARVDRMVGQVCSVCIAVEKEGSRGFLEDWFGDYGVNITALSGYASQTLVDKLRAWQRRDGRDMHVLYAGDHDASGEDIDRDLRDRLAGSRIYVRRVGLLPEHVQRYGLPRSPFEKEDSRAAAFVARHGGLWQTELDALDPDVLRGLFEDAFAGLWDTSVYEERLSEEHALVAAVLA